MKNFLTLLAAIASLSAYTLVGVHAACATCPKTMSGGWGWLFLFDPGDAYRQGRYQKNRKGASLWCYYDSNANLNTDRSSAGCGGGAKKTSTCPKGC
ncbi:hypothetical protein PAXINDRAFT_20170 [Paxillus involutus ATCC 200175]|uniref:Uncharacterized protein n=1 Tax=Paxillus involutus ATCC 200175 TaxID=664439 RepID=A0A0C9TES0_PAXIN|nr:hypothetical protein PAXINDRAFT_20170 [Paxillus involutus ATCC 200175]